MPWYAAGTISVASSGTTATGTGTAFLGNIRVGDGLAISGSSSLHEVTGVTSNTQLTFSPPFTGTAGGGKAYRAVPVLGYDKDLSDAFNALRLEFGSDLANLKPWATAATGGEAMDEMGFGATGKDLAVAAGADEAREAMELGTSALQDEDYFARGNGVASELDACIIPGMYSYPDSAAGAPDPRNGALIVAGSTDSDIIQLASSVSGDLWLRRADTGAYPTWGPWRCITSIGIDQAWGEATTGRAKDVVYTNTTQRPIMVSVGMASAVPGSSAHVTLFVDGVAVADQLLNGTTPGPWYTLTAIVPPGSTYYATSGSAPYSADVRTWMELR